MHHPVYITLYMQGDFCFNRCFFKHKSNQEKIYTFIECLLLIRFDHLLSQFTVSTLGLKTTKKTPF